VGPSLAIAFYALDLTETVSLVHPREQLAARQARDQWFYSILPWFATASITRSSDGRVGALFRQLAKPE
jgi:hypothetical protein